MKEMRDYRNVSIGGREMRDFNNFIHDLGVEDIPFNIGRRYMWYRSSTHSIGGAFLSHGNCARSSTDCAVRLNFQIHFSKMLNFHSVRSVPAHLKRTPLSNGLGNFH